MWPARPTSSIRSAPTPRASSSPHPCRPRSSQARSPRSDRRLQQLNSIALKDELTARGIPVIPNPSHICPILVGDASKAKAASDLLLSKHQIYVQSINFPTVPRGEERLRITPTPGHTVQQQTELVAAIESVWAELGLKRAGDWEALGGRAGVGLPNQAKVDQLWTPAQLGLLDGTAPRRIGAESAGPIQQKVQPVEAPTYEQIKEVAAAF
jgi:5-aminolevulinate synthase